MKMLIITQKVDVNDPILGFFHRWIEEFAKQCDSVSVICLYKGTYDLPTNVSVYSLGKENGVSRLTYIFNFLRYIVRLRKDYDTVFVHMNQIYVLLGGLVWRLLDRKIGFWYAHGQVSFSLKIAERLSHIIFSSTRSGFRITSKKLKITGQGIDVDVFTPLKERKYNDVFRIISVGRISPIKDYETLINAANILVKKNIPIEVIIVGAAGLSEQEGYLAVLKGMIKEKNLSNIFHFKGAMSNKNIIPLLQESDVFASASHTGSLDKAMLEAMSVGIPVITCNEAMLEVLGKYQDNLIYVRGDYDALAEKIINIRNLNAEQKAELSGNLRDIVVREHNIHSLVGNITTLLSR